MKAFFITLLAVLAVTGTDLLGARDRPFVDEPSTERDGVEDAAPWQEQGGVLPAYPDDADLLEFNVDMPGSPFRFFIDGKNLVVGEDGVVRYTLVVKSSSGAANVSYEGMRCNVREFKVYAYGTGRGAFKALKEPRWEEVRQSGYDLHHRDLREFYLCETLEHRPYKVADIIQRLNSAPRRNEDRASFF